MAALLVRLLDRRNKQQQQQQQRLTGGMRASKWTFLKLTSPLWCQLLLSVATRRQTLAAALQQQTSLTLCEFDATFAFADADGEEEDKEDFEDFGDFTSAPQRRRSSSSNAGSLRLSAGQATRALGAASPVNLSPTSESPSTSPRTLRGNRTRLESGFSSDGEGEGRPSDVDEFGDNDRFSSYAEGRLSLTKIQIATKANGNGNENGNENENDKCFDSSSSETAEANSRMPGREREAAPTRLSGSGAEGGDDFGAFEG
jgi:hypothetical protein